MFFYQIKVVIKENKVDEFVESLRSLSIGFRKENGCLEFSMYRDTEKENTFSVIGEWKTRPAMDKHFKNKNFEVLIGAARVLGETFKIDIGETPETGGFQLAREKISLQPKESRASAD
jgi:quinol monooxygenase YgiN